MGRGVGRTRRTRRGLPGRATFLLALVLVLPAAGFSALGWRSLEREHAVRVLEMGRAVDDAVVRRVGLLRAELERIRTSEGLRDPTLWQEEHLPRSFEEVGLAFQATPLVPSPAEPLVRGWFQWELLDGAPIGARPEVFPAGSAALAEQLGAAYGGDLALRLERAPDDIALRGRAALVRRYPLRFIAANEERGQLLEELLHLNQRSARRPLQVTARGEGGGATPYIDSFERRTQGDLQVAVHLTPFRWLARAEGAAGPELVLWRLVWIPAEHEERREVRRDRWFIQGAAFDLSSRLPRVWEKEGSSEIGGGGALARSQPPPTVRVDLLDELEAETASLVRLPPSGSGDRAALLPGPNPDLLFVGRVAPGAVEGAWTKMRDRFLLLLAGLAAILAGGFVLLVRMLRGEHALLRRKEDFIAAITHELKTPLTGIRMYAEMLKEGWVDSPASAERYAERIIGESERLGHLVNQVLDLAALERGVAQLHARSGDLGAAVEEAVGLMQSRAREQGVTLDLDIEPGLAPVTFDPRLVKPLVLNLLDNAIKYGGRAEHPTVVIRVARDGERTVVSVADRGPGIDPAVRRALFQPFQRAQGELTRDTPGIGIGLALVKRYADAHRARVVVDSEAGRGTTVSVRFR